MSEKTAKNTLVELGVFMFVIREQQKRFMVGNTCFWPLGARLFRQTDNTNTLTQNAWEFRK